MLERKNPDGTDILYDLETLLRYYSFFGNSDMVESIKGLQEKYGKSAVVRINDLETLKGKKTILEIVGKV